MVRVKCSDECGMRKMYHRPTEMDKYRHQYHKAKQGLYNGDTLFYKDALIKKRKPCWGLKGMFSQRVDNNDKK